MAKADDADYYRPVFKDGLSKHHFCNKVKKLVRVYFRRMYRGPEQAWATLDFEGRGYILPEDILNNNVMTVLKQGAQISR